MDKYEVRIATFQTIYLIRYATKINKCYPLGHITRCRSQATLFQEKIKARQFLDRYELDNTRSSWRDLSKGVYVRHDVVSTFLLFLRCDLELFGGEVLINQHGYRRYIE